MRDRLIFTEDIPKDTSHKITTFVPQPPTDFNDVVATDGFGNKIEFPANHHYETNHNTEELERLQRLAQMHIPKQFIDQSTCMYQSMCAASDPKFKKIEYFYKRTKITDLATPRKLINGYEYNLRVVNDVWPLNIDKEGYISVFVIQDEEKSVNIKNWLHNIEEFYIYDKDVEGDELRFAIYMHSEEAILTLSQLREAGLSLKEINRLLVEYPQNLE